MKILIAILMVVTSCQKPKENIYTIKSHYSCQSIKVAPKTLNFRFKFDESAKYELDTINQRDWNKLTGFTQLGRELTNSCRIAWRWYNDSLQMTYYIHDKGNTIKTEYAFWTTKLNVYNYGVIKDLADEYYLEVEGVGVYIPKHSIYDRYYCYPYFGGDQEAPHKIKIYLEFI